MLLALRRAMRFHSRISRRTRHRDGATPTNDGPLNLLAATNARLTAIHPFTSFNES